MIFSYLTLATALIISLSAAVYSILGLTAIFAAAFWPIVIMGGSLEVGKIVATLWLHKYWSKAEIQYKAYLCVAVAILMMLTSMGVFGFLSKAHGDQSLVSGDSAAKVAVYDEKIKTERDNVDANRKALKQMDEAVDQVMARSTTEGGADKAVAIRRSQQKERARLLAEIGESQKKIASYNEERAPIAAENRKVEAEVGPVKYIAALIYGDNPEANVLEKAVRWVIILIVIVFDPLALTLLLAATKSIEWEHGIDVFNMNKKKDEEDEPKYEPDDGPLTDDQIDQINKVLKDAEEKDEADEILKQGVVVDPADKKPRWSGFGFPMSSIFNKTEEPKVEEPVEQLVIDEPIPEPIKRAPIVENELSAWAKKMWHASNPDDHPDNHHALHEAGEIDRLPWHDPVHIATMPISDGERKKLLATLAVQADNVPKTLGTVTGFGTSFPQKSNKGDLFLRVDQLPTVLYKFNGTQWIEVDKSSTDSYVYDEAYVNHLIEKIGAGEYDPDLLSDAEREQIALKLKDSPSLG